MSIYNMYIEDEDEVPILIFKSSQATFPHTYQDY